MIKSLAHLCAKLHRNAILEVTVLDEHAIGYQIKYAFADVAHKTRCGILANEAVTLQALELLAMEAE